MSTDIYVTPPHRHTTKPSHRHTCLKVYHTTTPPRHHTTTPPHHHTNTSSYLFESVRMLGAPVHPLPPGLDRVRPRSDLRGGEIVVRRGCLAHIISFERAAAYVTRAHARPPCVPPRCRPRQLLYLDADDCLAFATAACAGASFGYHQRVRYIVVGVHEGQGRAGAEGDGLNEQSQRTGRLVATMVTTVAPTAVGTAWQRWRGGSGSGSGNGGRLMMVVVVAAAIEAEPMGMAW